MNLGTVSGNPDRYIGSLKDDPASGFIEYATHSFTLSALHLVQKLSIDTHFPLLLTPLLCERVYPKTKC